jgi:crooked neck
MAPPPIKNK